MKVKNKKLLKRIIIRRSIRAFIRLGEKLSYGLVILLAIIVIKMSLGGNLFKPSVEPPSSDVTLQQPIIEEQTIANNIDTLILLQEETWITLTIDEKISVLQTVANVERNHLGLPHELHISAEYLNDGIAGHYSDSKHQIVLNMDRLYSDSSRDLLDTVTHEAYHSLEHRMVEAYNATSEELRSLIFYYEASVYKEELGNYINSSEDFNGYYSQKCEEDARRYAEQATNDYFEKITAYLNSR